LDNGILPNPVTPESVSSFLRNGLVVGLDKAAVGQYLGEKGKAPSPDKNPPVWDCEWFHKDVLAAFCSSFAFENQSLLDGLRMFLATFRLPGEAQMIDRILQGFSESCGCSCEESVNGSLKLFSKDEKRASDAAYLLSFSIIMLNTDLVRVRVEIIVSIQFRLFASPTVHHLSTTIT
jgi:brefeldin A-resistance guanine nucleotide exchange factor 1